jgi:hypothetical protein
MGWVWGCEGIWLGRASLRYVHIQVEFSLHLRCYERGMTTVYLAPHMAASSEAFRVGELACGNGMCIQLETDMGIS